MAETYGVSDTGHGPDWRFRTLSLSASSLSPGRRTTAAQISDSTEVTITPRSGFGPWRSKNRYPPPAGQRTLW